MDYIRYGGRFHKSVSARRMGASERCARSIQIQSLRTGIEYTERFAGARHQKRVQVPVARQDAQPARLFQGGYLPVPGQRDAMTNIEFGISLVEFRIVWIEQACIEVAIVGGNVLAAVLAGDRPGRRPQKKSSSDYLLRATTYNPPSTRFPDAGNWRS